MRKLETASGLSPLGNRTCRQHSLFVCTRVPCAVDINETGKWRKMDGDLLVSQAKTENITFQYLPRF